MDDDNNILDEISKMDDFEAAEFQDKILPIHLTLVKVRNIDHLQRSKYSLSSCSCEKISFKVVNSSTKLLPEWKQIVAKLKRAPKMIPRDISMR